MKKIVWSFEATMWLGFLCHWFFSIPCLWAKNKSCVWKLDWIICNHVLEHIQNDSTALSLNEWAKLKRLVVFIVENNGYAMGTSCSIYRFDKIPNCTFFGVYDCTHFYCKSI